MEFDRLLSYQNDLLCQALVENQFMRLECRPNIIHIIFLIRETNGLLHLFHVLCAVYTIYQSNFIIITILLKNSRRFTTRA
jgi:hypothetical protein